MTTSTATHTFHISFWRIYFASVVYGQALFAPLMWVVFYLQARQFNLPFPSLNDLALYVAGSVLVGVFLAPAFVVYVRMMPVRVSPDSFTCPNGFGKLVSVPWSALTRVKPLHIPGFPYLMVSTSQTRFKLWFPLILSRLPECAELVERYAGADHMLYQALWPRVEQK